MLCSFSDYNKIDILMLQEHNVKDVKELLYFYDKFTIILNPSSCRKGGTCILIKKKFDFIVKHIEKLSFE